MDPQGFPIQTVDEIRIAVEMFLGQIKKASPVSPKDSATAVKVVREGLGLIKKLTDQIFNSDINQSKSEKESIQALIKRLVEGLSNVRLSDGDKRSRDLSNLIAHYRTEWLPNDDELVERFQNARAEYSKTPDDVETARRFGWVLHECLKASYKRLSNVKLTEFFLKQFEEWQYSGEANEGISKLLAVRKNDIERAKDFLFSPIDAQRLYNTREWHKAIVACEFFLAGHPDNAVAWRIRAGARFQLLAEAKKNGDTAQLADQTALFLESALDFATHVPSSEEAAKLVLDAASERYWTLAKIARNPPANTKQKVTFLCDSLIKAFSSLSQVFGRLVSDETDKRTQRRCVDMATRIVESMYWEVTRHPIKNSNPKAFSDIATLFVSLILIWGLDSLEDKDRDWYASGRKERPFAARVVLALLACVSLGDAAHIVETNPWLLRFCEAEASLFSKEPSSYCSRMAKVLLKLGNPERARPFALQVVRQNQTERWRWRLLAGTYPNDSQERNDCLATSSQGEQKAILSLLKQLDPEVALSHEKQINEKIERASYLLVKNEKTFSGIVISCFTEMQHGLNRDVTFDHKKYIRVWWKGDKGEPFFDFVPMEPSQDLDNLGAGAPVLVTVSESLGRSKAVKIVPREDGMPFDIYPYSVGVVITKNISRHYLKIAYDIGKSCGIDAKKYPFCNELDNGSFCRIALFEREGMAPLVLDVRPAKTDISSLPPFAKEYSGILVRERGSRNACVERVAVDADKFSIAMLGKTVKGIAVNSLDKGDQPQWRAASCVAE